MIKKRWSAQVQPIPADWADPQPLLLQLVEARLELQVSQQQAADFLRLPINYIEAMETGRFECLPNRTFARGYLRAYANYLDLPVEQVMQAIAGYAEEGTVSPKPLWQITSQLKPGDPIVRATSYFIAALCLALSAGWWVS